MTQAGVSDAGESAKAKTGPRSTIGAAWDALSSVYDPELGLDVVSLGLVYDVRDENGTVVVEMTLTTEGCPASESIQELAEAAIASAIGSPATAVDLRIVWDPPWSPAMMNDDAARALGFPIP